MWHVNPNPGMMPSDGLMPAKGAVKSSLTRLRYIARAVHLIHSPTITMKKAGICSALRMQPRIAVSWLVAVLACGMASTVFAGGGGYAMNGFGKALLKCCQSQTTLDPCFGCKYAEQFPVGAPVPEEGWVCGPQVYCWRFLLSDFDNVLQGSHCTFPFFRTTVTVHNGTSHTEAQARPFASRLSSGLCE